MWHHIFVSLDQFRRKFPQIYQRRVKSLALNYACYNFEIGYLLVDEEALHVIKFINM
jgi:hypothetical protein